MSFCPVSFLAFMLVMFVLRGMAFICSGLKMVIFFLMANKIRPLAPNIFCRMR